VKGKREGLLGKRKIWSGVEKREVGKGEGGGGRRWNGEIEGRESGRVGTGGGGVGRGVKEMSKEGGLEGRGGG